MRVNKVLIPDKDDNLIIHADGTVERFPAIRGPITIVGNTFTSCTGMDEFLSFLGVDRGNRAKPSKEA